MINLVEMDDLVDQIEEEFLVDVNGCGVTTTDVANLRALIRLARADVAREIWCRGGGGNLREMNTECRAALAPFLPGGE